MKITEEFLSAGQVNIPLLFSNRRIFRPKITL